jgi:arylformamidase
MTTRPDGSVPPRALRCVNLAQPFYTGMPHGTRHEVPSFTPVPRTVTYADGSSETSTTEIRMAAHVGTHIDAARHFYPDAPTIDMYPYERFMGPGVVLDVRREGPVSITGDELRHASPEILAGDIVLLYTGYAGHFGQDAYRHHPYLSPDAASFLVERGVNIVGTDTITPDMPVLHRSKSFNHPIHRHLLKHDVLIIEHLGPGLKDVLGQRLLLATLPLRIVGADGSPITACAFVEERP